MRVAALIAVAFVLAGCGATKTITTTRTATTTTTVTQTVTTATSGFDELGTPTNVTYFGGVVSIASAGEKGYLLVVKPQFFLTGVTANSAGQTCPPLSCPGVDNDYRVIPAGTTKLTFVLPSSTKGTVLTNEAGNVHGTTVTAAQLSALFAGGDSPKLYEPLDSGLWFTVVGDTVTEFAQQYRP